MSNAFTPGPTPNTVRAADVSVLRVLKVGFHSHSQMRH